ncbi:MAG TPA: tetratricopeptide repeat protein, partial [Blastocatellia bacterium]|nr:tetratricopeptide repeat protein [Blastocatellia bacterium]
GATIEMWRTDISGHWEMKTDKKVHYIRLGMPFTGEYILAASAPGCAPYYLSGVRLVQQTTFDIEMSPSDGTRFTLDQIKKAMAGGGGGHGQTGPSEADKAKAAEVSKAQKEQAEKNEKLQAALDTAVKHYNTGVQLKNDKNLEGALSEFEQASSLNPAEHAYYAEIVHKADASVAEMNYQLGADLFNKKQRDEAKKHFDAAVDSINKAITVAPMDKSPTINTQLIVYYDILAKNVKLLVEFFGEANLIEPTVKALDTVEGIDQPANKKKWEIIKGDMYRSAGQTDQAVAAYKSALALDANNLDALYGIGLTLVASQDKEILQQAANYLGDFVAKAPATDKRVGDVKAAIDALKQTYNVEAEKPSKRKKGN